ncbi:MAG TPA: hypothetical protein VKO18_13375 [Terriglobia bacterium]|nr:hypothetical protein [Terriglobia bacterium]
MTTATYDSWSRLDPTDSTVFRWADRLGRVITTVKIHFLIELTRLFLLGFYDDFQTFLVRVEFEENRSESEAQFRAIFGVKIRAAERIEQLLSRLDLLGAVSYRGRNLSEYLVGTDRMEDLKLFVRAMSLEREGEEILDRSKKKFVFTVTQRKLTPNQRTALLDRYRELAQLPPSGGPLSSE